MRACIGCADLLLVSARRPRASCSHPRDQSWVRLGSPYVVFEGQLYQVKAGRHHLLNACRTGQGRWQSTGGGNPSGSSLCVARTPSATITTRHRWRRKPLHVLHPCPAVPLATPP